MNFHPYIYIYNSNNKKFILNEAEKYIYLMSCNVSLIKKLLCIRIVPQSYSMNTDRLFIIFDE